MIFDESKRVKNYEKYNLDQKTKFLNIIFQHDPLSSLIL